MNSSFCVLQAILDASAALGRPLSVPTVRRLVHMIEYHDGWPTRNRLELLDLVRDELDALLLVENGTTTVSPAVPCLVFYQTPIGDNHCVFTQPPFPDAKQLHYLIVLRPETKGGE